VSSAAHRRFRGGSSLHLNKDKLGRMDIQFLTFIPLSDGDFPPRQFKRLRPLIEVIGSPCQTGK
jgi:hypothetical protein